MHKRDKKGKFVFTNGGGNYKRKQKNGKNCMYSRLVWEEYFGEIPKGLLIHHIDKNKMNNDINNLALLTSVEHNLLHAKDRPIWNKGLTTKTNKKWNSTIEKRDKIKRSRYNKKLNETWNLYCEGYSATEIAKKLGICTRQVYTRFNSLIG